MEDGGSVGKLNQIETDGRQIFGQSILTVFTGQCGNSPQPHHVRGMTPRLYFIHATPQVLFHAATAVTAQFISIQPQPQKKNESFIYDSKNKNGKHYLEQR